MNIEKQKNDFDKWCGQWEKAVESGVFNDAPHAPKPTQKTSDDSYFGPVQNNPTQDVADVDAQYWRTVYAMSDNMGMAPDPIKASERMLQEEREAKKIQAELLSEGAEVDLGKIVKSMAQTANPIRAGSVGPDTALTPQALSLTFSEADIETLSELKIQLHNAQAMLIAYEIEGKKTKTQESKIANLKQKIDELSDAMTQVWPLSVSSQGD